MIHFVALAQHHWMQIPDDARPRHCEDTRGIVAIDDFGEMQAACVLDTWTENACQIHIYIPNPFVLKHGFQQEVFNFVFNSGRELIVGVTPSDNHKALKFIKHMGFTHVTTIPDGYEKGVDFIITQLRKENCDWIGEADGQQEKQSA